MRVAGDGMRAGATFVRKVVCRNAERSGASGVMLRLRRKRPRSPTRSCETGQASPQDTSRYWRVDMAEIGAQRPHVSQDRLRIAPAGFQRTYREGVAQVMEPRAPARRIAIAEAPNDPDEDHMGFCAAGRDRDPTRRDRRLRYGPCAGRRGTAQARTGSKRATGRGGSCRTCRANHQAVMRHIIASQRQSLRDAETSRGKQPERG